MLALEESVVTEVPHCLTRATLMPDEVISAYKTQTQTHSVQLL